MKKTSGQTRNILPHLANQRGRLLEIPILLALICISVAIGAGQYAKHGWTGFFLGTAIVFFGVIIAFAALIGIVSGVARAAQSLSKHGWFLTLGTVFKWVFFFLFFSLWGAIFSLGVGALFEFDFTGKNLEWYIDLIPLGIGAIWLILLRHFCGFFWKEFWRFSGVLVLGSAAVFIGLLIGQGSFKDPAQPMKLIQALFFLPLVLYVVIRLIRKNKPPEAEPPPAEP
ncbi:MAG: hypothetical protein AB1512_07900 [Thermodesulfobacteriota bacterium]